MGEKNFNDKLVDSGVWERICNIENVLGIAPNQKLDMSVLDNIKRINETIEDLQSLEERNKTLERDVQTQSEMIGELQDEKQKQKDEYEKKIKKLYASIESLETEKKKQEEKIEELETENKSQTESIQSLKEVKAEQEEKIEELETETKSQTESIQSLKEVKVDQEKKIEELETETKSQAESIQSLKEVKVDQEKKIEELETEIEELRNSIESKQSAWDQSVLEHKKLLLLMYKCKTLSEYIRIIGMDKTKEGNDFQSVVSFISLFGNETTFADLLYRLYEQAATALDADDYEFIKAINIYYRKRYNITFDALVIPEGENGKYDKEMMKDREKPNDVFSRFSEVYAPAVMRNEKAVEKRMIVKGEKS